MNHRKLEDSDIWDMLSQLNEEDTDDVPVTEEMIMGISEGELSLFIGKNEDTYLQKWREDSSWNWAAFIFDFYWLLYRRMYRYFFIYLAVVYFSIYLIGTMISNMSNSLVAPVITGIVMYSIFKVIIGVTGNQLYWRQAKRKIDRVHQLVEHVSSGEREIIRAGGVNLALPLILILLPAIIAGISSTFYFLTTFRAVSDSLSQNTRNQSHAAVEQAEDMNISPTKTMISSPNDTSEYKKEWTAIATEINGYNWSELVGYERLVVIVAGLMKSWEQDNLQMEGVTINVDQDAPVISELVVALFGDTNYAHMNLIEIMGVIKEQFQQDENSIDVSAALDEDLYYAVADDNYNEVVRLLDQGADPANSSSIIAATRNKNVALISILIQYGADPDYFFRGETPLSILVQDDEVELVSQLLDYGANPEMGTPLSSPLQIAVKLGSINMVQLLLKHGADGNSFIEGEKSILQIAEELGHTEIYQLLRGQEQ
ncbi:ankyrin repeat domain-containing protein [Paenibacillus polysaccharolyticus]|uniref:ankyrin repeat domain-containing protein n=1 Tax=Paenibacillus polysaccharolyticus TaxID=582692 RepID=UPI003009EADE